MDAYIRALVVVTGLKLLLIPAYRSTDFEVHRNWLAVTHSLPISQWYTDQTSKWTLDYPPLFAWFEWALSQVAVHVDPMMLQVKNLGYASGATVVFQRLSVMVADLVLASAAFACSRSWGQAHAKSLLAYCLIIFNAGLIMVDHIHFQYNGMLLGLLLWSVLSVERDNVLLAATCFAILLNLKHLFAYAAPVYFVYMLRHYCFDRGHNFSLPRLLALAAVVGSVCAVSFGPFVAMGQLPQIMGRLFPFGRGLCHAYWAGNFWALYSFSDKAVAAALPRLGVSVDAPVGNMSAGQVGISSFAVLPQIGPGATMIAVAAALAPALISLWRRPDKRRFAEAVAYSNLCGFVFGFHVHEKAALTAVIPFIWVAVQDGRRYGSFLILSTAANYGIFPLLFEQQEYAAKVFMAVAYFCASWFGGKLLFGPDKVHTVVSGPERAYLAGFLVVEAFGSVLHSIMFGNKLPFLPLMVTSVYCACGVVHVWARMFTQYVTTALGGQKQD